MIGKKALFELAKALEGLPIMGALPRTPAAHAGIRYGDVLISVNGRRTRSAIDYVEAKALRNDGMTIVVFRTGAEHAAELLFAEEAGPIDPAALLAELIAMRVAIGEGDGVADFSGIGGVSGVAGGSDESS